MSKLSIFAQILKQKNMNLTYKFSRVTKVAVPTRENMVDDHFGHCDHYTIFTIENNKVVAREDYPSPQGCGCKSGIAPVLRNMGIEVMLAGSMGDGARNVLAANGIQAIRGCSGCVDTLVEEYLAGKISDSGEGCHSHGEEGHVCHG